MRIAAVASVATLFLALGGMLASEPAEAHGRARVSVGIGFGYPAWGWGPYWGPWYPPPYAYYPAPVVVRSEPVTYIEQSGNTSSTEQNGWWYYCETSRGYYPYVKECPAGWQRVPPTPPAR